jgi:hypothetical protein
VLASVAPVRTVHQWLVFPDPGLARPGVP